MQTVANMNDMKGMKSWVQRFFESRGQPEWTREQRIRSRFKPKIHSGELLLKRDRVKLKVTAVWDWAGHRRRPSGSLAFESQSELQHRLR